MQLCLLAVEQQHKAQASQDAWDSQQRPAQCCSCQILCCESCRSHKLCKLMAHLIDVLQKALLLNLTVSEDEGNRLPLVASNLVQGLDVIKQVGDVVGLGDRDLEGIGSCRQADAA